MNRRTPVQVPSKKNKLLEVKQEVEDVPEEVKSTSENNVTEAPAAVPLMPEGTLLKWLEESVVNGKLNSYDAGSALLKAHANQYGLVEEEIERFLDLYSRKVTGVTSSGNYDCSDPQLALKVSFGNQIVGRLAFKLGPKRVSSNHTIDDIRGSVYWLSKVKFFYPQESPFSGEAIDFEDFRESRVSSHIRLKHLFVYVLSRSCTKQSDIQQKMWKLPNERAESGSTPIPFPDSFYKTLKHIGLHYFQIHEPELDAGQFMPEFSGIECLRAFADGPSKQHEYEVRSAAKETFLQETFDVQLKNAMVDINQGNFLPLQSGAKYQSFELRKRASKRAYD